MTGKRVQGTIDVGDGKLYYEMAGSGEPLVLVHAGFLDSRMWDDQWEAFGRDFQVVRFDMRGYGKSALTDGPISRRRDLEVLLDQLGIEHAVLLGCSMGGTIVLDYALEHPERVDALVLVSADPSGFEMQGEPPPNVIEMIAAMQRGDLERVSDLQVRLWVDGPFRGPGEVDPEVRRRAAEMNWTPVQNGTWSKVDAQPVDLLDPPAIGRLGEVRVPTLVVVGALDDPELLRAGEVLKAGIAGAEHVIIQGAAHVPNLEKPEAFNRVVVKFLAGARLMDAP